MLTVSGLGDKSILNMTQQYAEVHAVLHRLYLGTSVQLCAWMI